MPTPRALALILVCIFALAPLACSPSKEAVEARRERARQRMEAGERARQELGLASTAANVRTIQIYGATEDRLPVYALGATRGDNRLTLEFDVMGSASRPLSVYFYHADRTWNRDLMPVEYMRGFQRDDILDFAHSRATDVGYVHYTYTFPNQSVEFTVSGNYIVRVTEQGDEEQVLFEQPFFVTENTASQEMNLSSVMLSGSYPATLPLLRVTPPDDLSQNPYDYGVCFVRNGRYELARCSTNTLLGAMPSLHFELEPEMAFRPEAAEYYLDLSAVRVGHQIELADPSTSPPSVTVKPDYANFGGSLGERILNGQTVVSEAVDNVANPDVNAEYVETGFSMVPPDEQPLTGSVYVVGSFSGWQVDERNRMTWVPERGRYEGTVLLKQGLYEYRYVSQDQRFRRAQSMSPPRPENSYLAFVYYRDVRLNTDRLISVDGLATR